MKSSLSQAADIVHSGGIIAYPTEAVFGLGCDPDNENAVSRLITLKQRSSDKGLILIAANFSQLQSYCAPIPEACQQKIQTTWPGPHTWLFPVSKTCPAWLYGKHQTIAVRVTAHPLAADLCRTCKGALISTSANIAGQSPARDATQVKTAFPEGIDLIITGQVGNLSKPTPIRDALSQQIIRR